MCSIPMGASTLTCLWGCANGFCTNEGLQAHLKYTCPWGCANGFCTHKGLQAHLEYACPWGRANGFCISEGLQAHLVAEHGKSPVATTLRSHLAEYMRRVRDTRREAEMKRENQMMKEAQVKREVQIMRVHIRYDVRTKRGHNAIDLIDLINGWKPEIQTINGSTSLASFEQDHPGEPRTQSRGRSSCETNYTLSKCLKSNAGLYRTRRQDPS